MGIYTTDADTDIDTELLIVTDADCEVWRMYLSFATFSVYWYPGLMALGIYCLLDGNILIITFLILTMMMMIPVRTPLLVNIISHNIT